MTTSAPMSATRNSLCGLSLLLLLLAGPLCPAQRRVSADVEVKQALAGKVVTVTKSVYCSGNGRLVIHFLTPEEMFVVTNPLGEARVYFPKTGKDNAGENIGLSSRDELLFLFLSGRVDDLGVTQDGYRLVSTANEDGLLKKTFVSEKNGNLPRVEIVYQNYLPIYLAYLDPSGKAVNKTYFSNYSYFQRFVFPCRVTNITYPTPRDSSVTRTLYSNLKVDVDDPLFDYDIPAAGGR